MSGISLMEVGGSPIEVGKVAKEIDEIWESKLNDLRSVFEMKLYGSVSSYELMISVFNL